MKFRRSLAALSIAATSVVGTMVAPAQAANLNPDTVRGQVAPATVYEGATPGLNPACARRPPATVSWKCGLTPLP